MRDGFKGTAVNIMAEGQKHLGAVIGSREHLEDYHVSQKVTGWLNEVIKLAEFAMSHPQASSGSWCN